MRDKEPPLVINLDDLETKRRLLAQIGKLKGLWELHLKPRRLTRSLNQNAYWWCGIVTPFHIWLNEEWGEHVEMEQAHEMLKQKILGAKFIEIDGQAIAVSPSSRTLDTAEFGELIDKASDWLAKFCNIVVVPPEMYLEKRASDEDSQNEQNTDL